MSLQIGQQLGSYQITSLIGKGGMGEVYRAKDTKLKRDVAIKILPDEFSRDTDRVSRFQREAESLAALNHQNIAAIYDLQQSDATRFLILEFVEGDTLADILKKRGALPVDEALQIAKQISEALEAAHEKGIIHRDLKPANVKITPDGKVKVLDFGLAKAMESTPTTSALSDSPTLSMAATNAGVILGTAAYMSPEQAKGRQVDRRTDIFAFGAVFYEMLTGRAAFDGEDVQEILGSVLKSEPDWTRLPMDVPPLIPRLLRLCLQKDVKKRRQTTTDVRIDIEQAVVEPAGAMPAVTPTRSTRLAWIMFAAALLVAGVLAIPALRHLSETPLPAPPEMRVEINTPATSSFAISPDGRRLVFVTSGDGQPQQLWLRSLEAVTAEPLAGTEGASDPFWSPDSRSIGFFADAKLKRVDLGGGPPQTLANVTGLGGAWSQSGVILFAPNNVGPLFRIPASGGEAVQVTKVDAPRQNGHTYPHFMPGGKQFLFYAANGSSEEARGIYLGSLDSVETRRLTPADAPGLYAPPGWLLFIQQGTLVARRFDSTRGELAGDVVTVANSVVDFSVSVAGPVIYRAGTESRPQLTWFDRSGRPLGTLGAPNIIKDNFDFELSRDGRRVAGNRPTQNNGDIWILDETRMTRFTFDPSVDQLPVWSPDGSRIAFRSNRKGRSDLYVKPSNGGGSEELLLESPQDKVPTDWSPDGRFLLYHTNEPTTSSDLWVLPLEGDRKPFVFLKTEFNERHGQFSPDGRWVAYRSNESGRNEIYVRPFPGPGGQWQVSTAGGITPRWRADGKELYYIAPDGRMMAVPITTSGGNIEPGTPVALFQTRIWGGGTNLNRPQYDVAPDGRFLIAETVRDATISPITLLLNWNPPAK